MVKSKKKVVKKPAVKAVAPAPPPIVEEATFAVHKGDIVRAWNKNFLVETVSQRKRTLKATHLTYVESRIASDLSRTISFDDVHTVWAKVK
jgi:hypothetical protein